MRCPRCAGQGWVCENHPHVSWGVGEDCACGGAGAPCALCNPCDRDHPPRTPPGWRPLCEEEDAAP